MTAYIPNRQSPSERLTPRFVALPLAIPLIIASCGAPVSPSTGEPTPVPATGGIERSQQVAMRVPSVCSDLVGVYWRSDVVDVADEHAVVRDTVRSCLFLYCNDGELRAYLQATGPNMNRCYAHADHASADGDALEMWWDWDGGDCRIRASLSPGSIQIQMTEPLSCAETICGSDSPGISGLTFDRSTRVALQTFDNQLVQCPDVPSALR